MAPSLSPPFPHPVILVPRADTSDPATEKESTFSGQAFAIGLIVGVLICATIAGAVLLLRRRKQERVHLVPDIYNYVEPGTTQGHHIISEPTLGDDHDEVSTIGHSPSSLGHSTRSRRNTAQASMIMQIGTVQWAHSANDVTHTPTRETYPNTHLPTAFRDASGKFQAPESPTDWSGSPLQSPDPAFSHSALMRPISTASGESSTSAATQRSLFRKGEKSSMRAADDRSTVRSRDSKLKIELGKPGERYDRNRSARHREPPSSPTSAVVDTDTVRELPEIPNPGANVPPPYSMEEDPDPFGRRDPGPLPRKR